MTLGRPGGKKFSGGLELVWPISMKEPIPFIGKDIAYVLRTVW
jgi:hypothetical protein